jgi:hypothetical protein
MTAFMVIFMAGLDVLFGVFVGKALKGTAGEEL